MISDLFVASSSGLEDVDFCEPDTDLENPEDSEDSDEDSDEGSEEPLSTPFLCLDLVFLAGGPAATSCGSSWRMVVVQSELLPLLPTGTLTSQFR